MKTQLSKILENIVQYFKLKLSLLILLITQIISFTGFSQINRVTFKIEHDFFNKISTNTNTSIKITVGFPKNKNAIKMPAYAQIELDTVEFANPYVDNYLWLYPEIIYYNPEIKKWVKFDLNVFKYDYTPILLDPMGIDSLYIKDKVEYFPFMYFMRELRSYNYKFKIRFYGRLKLEDSIVILTSNWLKFK